MGQGSFSKRMAEVIGITPREFANIYFQFNHLVNTGKLKSWDEFDKLLLEKLGKPEKLETLAEMRDKFEGSWEEMDERMLELIKNLRQGGYKVGLLSNATRASGGRLRELGLTKYFDVFMISAEQGLQKPEPELFKRFAGELGVELKELIYIDDAESSLRTANELGYQPILFRGYEELLSELLKLGIELESN